MKEINKENFVLTVNNAKKLKQNICNIVIENNEKNNKRSIK